MNNPTNDESLPPSMADSGDSPAPTRKRAAKKVTAKKAVAKKTAVRKTAAKKVAGGSVASTVATESPPQALPAASRSDASLELPFDAPPTRAPRAKKAAAVSQDNEPASFQPSTDSEAPRRFGRVPGGGPVASREHQEQQERLAASPAPPANEEREYTPRPPHQNEGESRERSPREGQGQPVQGEGNFRQGESRSKRRREKRKRRKNDRFQEKTGFQPHGERQRPQGAAGPHGSGGPHGPSGPQAPYDQEDRRAMPLNGPKIEADGMLELAPKGFGFLRIPGKNFEQARDDIFVTPESIRKYSLRVGQWIHGLYQDGPRGPQLVEITKVNDMTPEEAAKLPHFDELKAINPTRRISFETAPDRYTTRVVDIMAPVGRGQRGLIVSPPRSGKTTLLLHMAEAIREKYDEAIHLMVVLVDERPEEVTEFRRALPGAEIYASSNDEQARNHTRIAELAIERAKRLVEAGKDVFLIMDSITRLARAYNGNMNNRGRGTGSGGITIGALEVPRRLFAAARNTRGGGSLTIMATALIQTNSRADEAIYMEFKGTGNMELVLDRKIAENYIYPAVDIFKSGTRREELLLADHMLHKIHLIRRGLSGHRPAEAMERLLFFQKKFPNNPQMLLEIKG